MNRNTNIEIMARAWADIVIRKWLQRMDRLKVHDTYQLANSFVTEIITQAKGDVSRIEFAFNYYGHFSGMGVGRGITLEDVDLSNRKKKPWYGPIFFGEVKKLTQLLAEKYGLKGLMAIKENIEITA